MSLTLVFKPARIRSLLVADAKNIVRDPTLAFALILSVAPAIAISIWRTEIDAAAFTAFELNDAIHLALPFLLSLPAFLIGWVIGFLLLEDRDEHTLLALDITPVGKGGYMLYRVALAMVLTAVVTIIGIVLLAPQTTWLMVLILSAVVAIEGACASFILPAVARNKVEGLAVTKLTNLFAVASMLTLIPSPWRYLGGFIPTFWFGEALQISSHQYLPLPLILGIAFATHLGAAWLLYKLVLKRVG